MIRLCRLLFGLVGPRLRYTGGDQATPYAHPPGCTASVHYFDSCGPGRPATLGRFRQ